MKIGWIDTLILEEYPNINYAVLYRPHAACRFVAAWMPVIDRDKLEITWSQGHYFDDLRDCMKYIEGLLANPTERYIIRKDFNTHDWNVYDDVTGKTLAWFDTEEEAIAYMEEVIS